MKEITLFLVSNDRWEEIEKKIEKFSKKRNIKIKKIIFEKEDKTAELLALEKGIPSTSFSLNLFLESSYRKIEKVLENCDCAFIADGEKDYSFLKSVIEKKKKPAIFLEKKEKEVQKLPEKNKELNIEVDFENLMYHYTGLIVVYGEKRFPNSKFSLVIDNAESLESFKIMYREGFINRTSLMIKVLKITENYF